jgi:hypothetical protein
VAVAVFQCSIPGADAATTATHAVSQMGLSGFVIVAGAILLARALATYRRDRDMWTLVERDSIRSIADEDAG